MRLTFVSYKKRINRKFGFQQPVFPDVIFLLLRSYSWLRGSVLVWTVRRGLRAKDMNRSSDKLQVELTLHVDCSRFFHCFYESKPFTFDFSWDLYEKGKKQGQHPILVVTSPNRNFMFTIGKSSEQGFLIPSLSINQPSNRLWIYRKRKGSTKHSKKPLKTYLLPSVLAKYSRHPTDHVRQSAMKQNFDLELASPTPIGGCRSIE